MRYENVVLGYFVARLNRFLARATLAGRTVDCHIKNTSRLRELLLPGAKVALCPAMSAGRKTAYDLIAVEHNDRWVNIDSQAPNKVFGEWLHSSGYLGELTLLRPECSYGRSRFDYYAEMKGGGCLRRMFIEVKGVTLVEDSVARFPGAPTLRGVKHIQELIASMEEGYEAMMVFVVQRDDVVGMGPNDPMQPAFGEMLRQAASSGVQLLALDCLVTPDSLCIRQCVDVIL